MVDPYIPTYQKKGLPSSIPGVCSLPSEYALRALLE